MNINQLLKRLKLASQNKELGIAFTNEEVLQVAIALLSSVETTNRAIEAGKVKGVDGKTPKAGVDFMSKDEQEAIIKETLASFTRNLDSAIKTKLDSLTPGKDGSDALISDELVGQIAGMAASLIEVPDVETAITASPESIRDALELFLDEDEKLQVGSIGGLTDKLAELQTAILTQSSKPAGGVSKNTVLSLIAANAGGGTFLSLGDTFSSYSGKGLEVVRVNTGETGLETVALAGGGNAQTADPLSQFAATTLAQLNGVISDATLGDEGDFATAAQGSTADSASQATGVENNADVTDTANVTAAGALMDSEVTNLAQVKAFDSTDYATSAQGTTADSALQARGAVNAQTGTSYTLVIGDEYLDGVRMTNASANTITIPPNADVALPVGTKVFITQGGAGSTTIAAGAGVTINAPSTVTLAIDEQWESRVCQKTATNTWLLI